MFALLVAASLPVRAHNRSAVSAYENGAYQAALGEFRTLAQSGDPAAQYHLGLMFKDGRGVRKDPVTALGWFICAAGSDGQIGRDATRWVEQLSSSLGGPSVLAAQRRVLDCRTLAENAPRPDTSEPSERPDSGNRFYWEDLKIKLDQFIEALSRIEIAGPDGDASAERTAASEPPKFGARSTVAAPIRRSVWSRAFFLPADETLVGSQYVAWELGATDLYRDLRRIARNDNKFGLGLFAVLWWLLIGKTLLSMGGVLMRVFRRSGLE